MESLTLCFKSLIPNELFFWNSSVLSIIRIYLAISIALIWFPALILPTHYYMCSTTCHYTLLHITTVNTYHYTLLHISQSLSLLHLPETQLSKCCWKLIYETLPRKEVVSFCPSYPFWGGLRRLPVVQAGDNWTIPFCNRSCSSNTDKPIATTTTWPELAWANVLCGFLGSGLVQQFWKLNEMQCVTYYYSLLHAVLLKFLWSQLLQIMAAKNYPTCVYFGSCLYFGSQHIQFPSS